MTLDQVMLRADAVAWAYGIDGKHPTAEGLAAAKLSMHELRAAILSYGRAERERAAKVCDSLVYATDHGGNKYSRPAPADRCAAYIRALPDEPALREQGATVAQGGEG